MNGHRGSRGVSFTDLQLALHGHVRMQGRFRMQQYSVRARAQTPHQPKSQARKSANRHAPQAGVRHQKAEALQSAVHPNVS